METVDVAVIGGGGAGAMAYLRSVLNCDRTVLFMGNKTTSRRGRAMWVGEVDNIPGMHDSKRPILGTVKSTLAWIDGQESLKGIGTAVKDVVTSIQRDGDRFILNHGADEALNARYVILATGIMDVQPEIGGSIEPIFPYANRGEAIYCVRCDGHRTLGHTLSVIGHNSTAASIAAMMIQRYQHKQVPILTNGAEPEFSESSKKLMSVYDMPVHTAAITEVLGTPRTGLEGFVLADGARIDSTRTIVSLGIIAYNQLLTNLDGQVDGSGKAVVSEKYESTIPGLFVVGDLVAGRKMQIYTAWDEAVDAADEINRRLRTRGYQELLGDLT
ncbi:MAG: NAD(P)/FAD-dependent oxidoreductase [Acidobacteria bacterium]|uniref:NAD(P)/FAD-dependent oxidoreductase n=1 Tax=Candidatus Polarisedimenticola svalbardensis TaxID=2886004 RepID=A0A8J6XX62_9BACT|nr:NAD(P)/FAD-dependent oxidoreductase [Candidatus Polarisedimenticola svalbardensis]